MYKGVLAVLLVFLTISCTQKNTEEYTEAVEHDTIEQISIEENFGFQLKNFKVERDTIKKGDNISLLLARHNYDAIDIQEIVSKIKDSFDFKTIKTGKTLTLLKEKEAPYTLQLMIYQPDKHSFSVVDFRDSIHAYKVVYPVNYRTKIIAGEIEDNLYQTVEKAGIDGGIATLLAKKFAWSIDFFKFEKGDRFAIYITEKYIKDSIYIGIEKLHGAYFKQKEKEYYGFPYRSKYRKEEEFFDQNGRQMRTMFLKAPLKYYKITSKYSKNRLHPIEKRMKAHKGTDYAAPQGTPIMTTASGVVIETGYTSGNGNYVKVKHDATYSTQYLHMSKILVRKGQKVEQGQIIGKVGSTGLATGPHLCYRFWKNGEQVDPFKQNLPTSMPLDTSELPEFLAISQPIKDSLDQKILEIFKNK